MHSLYLPVPALARLRWRGMVLSRLVGRNPEAANDASVEERVENAAEIVGPFEIEGGHA